jgi:hypothetical protein
MMVIKMTQSITRPKGITPSEFSKKINFTLLKSIGSKASGLKILWVKKLEPKIDPLAHFGMAQFKL